MHAGPFCAPSRIRVEARGEVAVQRELVVPRRVREVDKVAEMFGGCLPRQACEHADVVEEEEVVLLEPGAEDVRVDVAARDAGDGRMFELAAHGRHAALSQPLRQRAHHDIVPGGGRPSGDALRISRNYAVARASSGVPTMWWTGSPEYRATRAGRSARSQCETPCGSVDTMTSSKSCSRRASMTASIGRSTPTFPSNSAPRSLQGRDRAFHAFLRHGVSTALRPRESLLRMCRRHEQRETRCSLSDQPRDLGAQVRASGRLVGDDEDVFHTLPTSSPTGRLYPF